MPVHVTFLHLQGLAEACLLTASKAFKLCALGNSNSALAAEAEEKGHGRKDAIIAGALDEGSDVTRLQDAENKEKKKKRAKLKETVVSTTVDYNGGAMMNESSTGNADDAENGLQEAVMPHQSIFLQVGTLEQPCMKAVRW
jgi:hypothetical protein